MQRRQPDQRGEVLAAQGAQCWQGEHERPRTYGSDPGHTAEERLALTPHRTRTPCRIQGVLQGRQAVIAPRTLGLDVRVETRRGTPQAVLLRRPHAHALPPPGEKRTQVLRLRLRHWAGFGANRLRTMGQGTGVQGIGLGQLAGGLGKIAGLPWGDHDDGQSRCRQRGDGGALEPSGRFEHTQGRADPLSLRHKVCNTGLIVGHGPTGSGGAQGNIQMGFGHINTHKRLR